MLPLPGIFLLESCQRFHLLFLKGRAGAAGGAGAVGGLLGLDDPANEIYCFSRERYTASLSPEAN